MAKQQKKESQSFEESLAELEAIANDLEEGTIGLDEALARFETGVGLLRHCYSVLESAEGKIAELTGFDAEGNPIEKPFDASATAGQGTAGRRKAAKARPSTAAKVHTEAEEADGDGLF